jgi:hypothetical protein
MFIAASLQHIPLLSTCMLTWSISHKTRPLHIHHIRSSWRNLTNKYERLAHTSTRPLHTIQEGFGDFWEVKLTRELEEGNARQISLSTKVPV